MNCLLFDCSTRGPLCVLASGTLLFGCLLAVPASTEAQYGERKASRAAGEETDFSAVVEAKLPAMYAVGHPRRGYANGFCIHRSARLLVTAAHVVDVQKEYGSLYAGAYGDGPNAGNLYKVERAWFFKPGQTDVAIVQLEGCERGKPLPAAFAMFEEREGEDPTYVGRQVGELWFKGLWSRDGGNIAAIQEEGVVKGAAGFEVFGGFSYEGCTDEAFFSHTAEDEQGSSGSPLFLPDGRVIGVQTRLGLDGHSGIASNAFWVWVIICNEPELRGYFDPPANESEILQYLDLVRESANEETETSRSLSTAKRPPAPSTGQADGRQAEATRLRHPSRRGRAATEGYAGQAKQPPKKRGYAKKPSRPRSY